MLFETAVPGAFEGLVSSAQAPIYTQDGVLQIWEGDQVIATYYDADDGSGNAVTVTAQADVEGLPRLLYAEDFETGLSEQWTVTGINDQQWQITDTAIKVHGAGLADVNTQASLQLDCSLMREVHLHFYHDLYLPHTPLPTVRVLIAVNQGDPQEIAAYTETQEGIVDLDISLYADGQSQVLVSWSFEGAKISFLDSWSVDDVEIHAIQPPTPPEMSDLQSETSLAQPVSIELCVIDEGVSVANSYRIIDTLPRRGMLEDPDGGMIMDSDLPYTLLNNGSQVIYTPNACFIGQDTFTCHADDGGQVPYGGTSLPVGVTIEVLPPALLETSFETGLPEGWEIIDGSDDQNTWQPGDDEGRTYMYVTNLFPEPIDLNEQLIVTVPMDFSQSDQVLLRVDQKIVFSEVSVGRMSIEYRIGEQDWHVIEAYEIYGDIYYEYAGQTTFDLTADLAGQTDVRFRFNYDNPLDRPMEWYLYRVEIRSGQFPLAGDFEADCDVDLMNFSQLASVWGSTDQDGVYDPVYELAEPTGLIDLADLAVFAENWLQTH
jgi:hypothetical protein